MKPLLLASLLAAVAMPAVARQLTIDDLTMLSRIGAPKASKDGRWLVWAQRETDIAADRGRYDLWRLDLTRRGARPEPLVAQAEVNENDPQIVGDTVYFSSDKGGGDGAVWAVPVTGGTPRKLTGFDGGFGGFKVSPDATRLLVWADRKPGAPSLAPAMEKKAADAGAGRTYDRLFVRHWDSWADGTRSQLFVLPLGPNGAPGDGVAIGGALVGDTPSKPFGGGEEVAWSPDSRTVYFALREAGRIEATSTNLDIFSAPADGSTPPLNLTPANDATDNLPAVSPDGRQLAWVAMAPPGYEADRQVLMVRDLAGGQVRALTQGWDRSVGSVAWAPDGRALWVAADDVQETPLFRVDVGTGKVTRWTDEGHVSAVAVTPRGAVVAMNSLLAPDDFFSLSRANRPQRLTSVNATKLAGVDMPTVTRFDFKGANGDTVYGYAVKPAGSSGKVPLAYMIHGGPQGSSNNSWSYRWNPAVFAGAGYGLVAVDFHGSTGYGQGFTDAIRSNWGGWPLEDLKAGLVAATAKFAWLDGDKACALGVLWRLHGQLDRRAMARPFPLPRPA